MHSLFIENRCLLFSRVEDREDALRWIISNTHQKAENIEIYLYNNLPELKRDFDQKISQNSKKAYLIICSCPAVTYKDFYTLFKLITAGGGLVRAVNPCDGESKYLYIFRKKYWDLPKGKQEQGEEIACTALREVMEETGVEDLHIEGSLPETLHFMLYKGEWVIKQTFWFRMQYKPLPSSKSPTDLPLLKPQIEEGIEEACWLSLSEIESRTSEMFPSILFLTRNFFSFSSELCKGSFLI